MKTYEKPVVSVDTGLAEGVYAASGATQGTLNVTTPYVFDRWSGGGHIAFQASWSNITGTITLKLNFNDTLTEVATEDAAVQTTLLGKTATLTFANTVSNPLSIYIKINHGTSIDDLKMTGFTYSVS